MAVKTNREQIIVRFMVHLIRQHSCVKMRHFTTSKADDGAPGEENKDVTVFHDIMCLRDYLQVETSISSGSE